MYYQDFSKLRKLVQSGHLLTVRGDQRLIGRGCLEVWVSPLGP